MTAGENESAELQQLYTLDGKDTLYIAKAKNYASPKDVADRLKNYEIPQRPDDTAKTTVYFQKQSDKKTDLSGLKLTAKQDYFTESINVTNYRRAQIGLNFGVQGTIANITVTITFQVGFSSAPANFYDVTDLSIGTLTLASTDLPAKRAYSITTLGGDVFRLKITTSGTGTLSSSNYIVLNNVIGSFFGD